MLFKKTESRIARAALSIIGSDHNLKFGSRAELNDISKP